MVKASSGWLFLCSVFASLACSGQRAISIKPQLYCQLSEVAVPVTVSGFNDVGAFTLLINIDTNSVRFVSLENTDTLLNGGIVDYSFVGSPLPGISISWFRVTPVNISDGKLFDLHCIMLDSMAEFVFSPSCEIALSDLSIAQDVQYGNGNFFALGTLDEQPQPISVAEQTDAVFQVSGYAGVGYQWQENKDGTWRDLNNTGSYSGVFTNELLIRSVPYSFHSNRYRSVLSLGNCHYNSNEAELKVSALAVPEKGDDMEDMVSVFPNPLHGSLHLVANTAIMQAAVKITDSKGSVVFDAPPKNLETGETLDINLLSLVSGIYVLQVFDKLHRPIETQRLMVR